MSTGRKPRASRAKSSQSKSSPLGPSPLNSSPVKSSKATKKLPTMPSSNVGENNLEDFPSFNNELSSTLLSPARDVVPDTSATNGEQSSVPQSSPSVSADSQNGKRARTVSELPSLPLLSNSPLSEAFIKQLRQLIPIGPLIPSWSHRQHTHPYHIVHKGFVFSLFECIVICAIRMFVQNKDGSWADDDTATEVIKAIRDTKSTVDCRGLYEHMILKGSSGNPDRDDWEMQVYNELQNRHSLWAETAQVYWKGWMAYMNNICRRYKDEGRLEEITGVVPEIDIEPFRTVYESGQPLSFMQQMPVQRNGQRPNRSRWANQWASQTAMLSPMQMQLPDQWPNQTMLPMPPQTQIQMPDPWDNQVRMQGPAPMRSQNQWANQTSMPVMAEYPVWGASQMLTYQQLQTQRRIQMQMQMGLQRHGYIPQMQQMPTEAQPLIPSTPELQMPAPKRPAEASDIAGIATQMLTPFSIQPATLASQADPPERQRRRAKDVDIQE